jgi:hypothetical protein
VPVASQYAWNSADFESPVEPEVTTRNPDSSVWTDPNYKGISFDSFIGGGWAGGTLTLNRSNKGNGLGGGQTIITFLPNSSFYPPVSIEYVDT